MWFRDRGVRILDWRWGLLSAMLLVVLMVGCAANGSHNVKADEEILPPVGDNMTKAPGEDQAHGQDGGMAAARTATATLQDAAPTVVHSAGQPSPVHNYRPPVVWEPAYSVGDVEVAGSDTSLPHMRVGASIKARGGKVVLRDVLKGLAELKGMNVGWASDVDQTALVDVHISPDDDFWEAVDNLLRQLDYFYEFKHNTIFVKYKDTKRFYVPVPFIKNSYRTAVGGDLLGAGTDVSGVIRGNVAIDSSDDDIDIWKSIEDNLSRILKLSALAVPVSDNASVEGSKMTPGLEDDSAKGLREGFFYTIDKPLGIITVTAPRSLLEQVAAYIESVRNELSRQVLLEAKIIEVRLDRNSQRGVDWGDLLSKLKNNNNFHGRISFGDNNILYPSKGVKLIGEFDIFPKDFDILVNALDEFGEVKILSNPKLSLLNGQPAMITVGESVKYIDRVTSTVNSGTTAGTIVTYSVDTASVLSGLGFSVVANIAGDDEVILHLTPVTSELQEPIEYRQFGTGDVFSEVGLPRVKLRELTTMVRIKSGQVLIIGGLISNNEGSDDNQVPFLGDVPLVGHLFKNTRKYQMKRELIILLRPEIVKL